MIEDALRFTFEKLNKEQLIDLAILLTVEGLHSAGRKPVHYKSNDQKPCCDQNELIFSTRQEAESVFAAIYDHFKKFDEISLMDVLEISGFSPILEDAKTGWWSLKHMHIRKAHEGWQIVMPWPMVQLGK